MDQRSHNTAFAASLFLDIDRFKLINDTRGHAAGDKLLAQIGARLSAALGVPLSLEAGAKPRLVSRFGGDEFLVLLNDLSGPDAVPEICDLLLSVFMRPFPISGGDVHSNASVGVVTSEQWNRSSDQIVRKADMALYESKRAGRGRATLFSSEMQWRLTRNAVIETDLRRAIDSNELYLVFQPIVDLTSGKIASAEALVRWQLPSLGLVSPAEFVTVAEESGLIILLGRWVQLEACRTLVAWQRVAPHRAPSNLSINISRAELASGNQLLNQLGDLLQSFGLAPQCLQLEVTEREVMRTPEEANVVLRKLKQLGTRIAMDDFGTGTSSLGVLRSFPFDTIKIDNSFVRHLSNSPDGLAVLQAAVTLIENLGMRSVAEGVETQAQLAALQSLRCHSGQGYFLGKPVRGEVFLETYPEYTLPRADHGAQSW